MATKVDPLVAKQRQQKMILIFGAVILAGLLAFQGPKLMKHNSSKSSSAAPTATTTTTGTAPTTTPTTTPSGATTLPAVSTGGTGGQTAQVAGVALRAAGAPSARTGQLWSLSRFKTKDPFVPRVKNGSSSGSGTPGKTSAPGTTAPGSTTGPVATPTTSSPVVLGYATLMVNGKPQQLQLKQLFPKAQPTFVLLGVDKKSVRIGVAGGKFTGGGAVKLALGKPVTVLNTTTGQRFVMKLVFTGAQPEQIAGFNQAAPAGQTTTTSTQTTTASTP
jgi:hypothetical protein